MKKKRWISYLIALAIALTMIPKSVSATEEGIEEKSLDGGNVKITKAGTYRISQTDYLTKSTTNTIAVSVDSGEVYIILNGVNIDVSGIDEKCAFYIALDSKANVTVELAKGTTNTLKSGLGCAGLQKNGIKQDVGTLTITGTGSLVAIGGDSAAGIGGGIVDNGAIIVSSVNNIKIEGGTVTATGGISGPGIGGSEFGSVNNITISGGTVTATGRKYFSNGGNGIGGGDGTSNIKITGGSVKAIGESSADIGTIPTNADGTANVYLAKLENQDGVNNVTVDGKTYTRQGNHPNDSAFYLYLTGEDHTIVSGTNYYKATWNNGENNFEIKNKAPTPTVLIKETTANSITVNELSDQNIYGTAEYRIDGQNWQKSNVFTGLKSNTNYTVYAKYTNDTGYIESEAGSLNNVLTAPASYTISIPSTTLTAGSGSSTGTISVNTSKGFDLGYNGHVDVKIQSNNDITSDGKLILKRQNDNTGKTITSALLVNGSTFGDINKNVATFKTKDDNGVSISFAKPEGTILAGTYQGTITFQVSYSEQ